MKFFQKGQKLKIKPNFFWYVARNFKNQKCVVKEKGLEDTELDRCYLMSPTYYTANNVTIWISGLTFIKIKN